MSINLKREIKAQISVAVDKGLGQIKNDLAAINKLVAALDRLSTKLEFRNAMDQAKELKKETQDLAKENKKAADEKKKADRESLKLQKEQENQQKKSQTVVKRLVDSNRTSLEKLNDNLQLNQQAYGKTATAARNAATIVNGFLTNSRNKAFANLEPLEAIAQKIKLVKDIAKQGGVQFQINMKPLLNDLERVQAELLQTKALADALEARKAAIRGRLGSGPISGFAAFESRANEINQREELQYRIRQRLMNRQGRMGNSDGTAVRLLSGFVDPDSGNFRVGANNAGTRRATMEANAALSNASPITSKTTALAQLIKNEEEAAIAAEKKRIADEKAAATAEKKANAIRRVSSATQSYTKHVPVLNREIERQDSIMGKLLKTYNRIGFAIFQLQYSTLAITAALGVGQFTMMTDQYIQFENSIALASSSQAEFAKGMQEVRDIARQTFQDVDAVSKLYRSFATAAKSANITQDQVIQLTRNTSILGAVSGSNTESLNAALYQFGQGINSDRFGGEELRSVSEQAQTLFRAIVAGVNKVGINEVTPQMRRDFLEASKKGLVGQRELIAALLSEEVTEAAKLLQKNIRPTFAGVFQNLVGTFEKLFGEFNNSANITGVLAKAVNVLDGALFDTPEKMDRLTRSIYETGANSSQTEKELAKLNSEYIKNVENLRNLGTFIAILGATALASVASIVAYNAAMLAGNKIRAAQTAALGLNAAASGRMLGQAGVTKAANSLTKGPLFNIFDMLGLGTFTKNTANAAKTVARSSTLMGTALRVVTNTFGALGVALRAVLEVFKPVVLVIGLLSLVLYRLYKNSGTTYSIMDILAGTMAVLGDVISSVVNGIGKAIDWIARKTGEFLRLIGLESSGGGVRGGRGMRPDGSGGFETGGSNVLLNLSKNVFDYLGERGKGRQNAPLPAFTGGGFGDGRGSNSSRAAEADKKAAQQARTMRDFINGILDQAKALTASTDVFTQNALEIAEKQRELKETITELSEEGAKGLGEFAKKAKAAIERLRQAQFAKIIKDINNEIGGNLFGPVSEMISMLLGGRNESQISLIGNQIQAMRDIGEKYLKDFSISDFVNSLMGITNPAELNQQFEAMIAVISKEKGSEDVVKRIRALFNSVKEVAQIVNDNELTRITNEINDRQEELLATAGMGSREAERWRRDRDFNRRGLGMSAEEAYGGLDALEDRVRANPYYGIMRATNDYLDSLQDVASKVEDIVSGTLKSIEDELVNFLTGEEADFGKIFKNIGKEIMRMTVQQTIMKPVTEWIQKLGGMFFKKTGNPTVSVAGQSVGAMNVSAGVVNISGGQSNGGLLSSFTEMLNKPKNSEQGNNKNIFSRIFDFFGSFGKNKSSGSGGGGGFWSSIGKFFSNVVSMIFHNGGVAGMMAPMRSVPAMAFAGAPRFHGGMNADKLLGLANNEIPAILQRGEVVLNKPQQERLIGKMGSTYAPTQNVNINLTYNAAEGSDSREDAKAMSAMVEKKVIDVLNRERMQGGMLR
jgi:tape measure domain-containing protein